MLEKCLQYYLKVIKIIKLNFYHQTKQKIYKKKITSHKKVHKTQNKKLLHKNRSQHLKNSIKTLDFIICITKKNLHVNKKLSTLKRHRDGIILFLFTTIKSPHDKRMKLRNTF